MAESQAQVILDLTSNEPGAQTITLGPAAAGAGSEDAQIIQNTPNHLGRFSRKEAGRKNSAFPGIERLPYDGERLHELKNN
ncbi:MAG TPA: hypothetical protein DEP05_00130 [Betaproteobacteria bacterium]|nr:hypothetical protein [Betaproteobacteria bacterium]